MIFSFLVIMENTKAIYSNSKMMRCPWILRFDLLPLQYTIKASNMAVPGLYISCPKLRFWCVLQSPAVHWTKKQELLAEAVPYITINLNQLHCSIILGLLIVQCFWPTLYPLFYSWDTIICSFKQYKMNVKKVSVIWF